MRFLPPAGGIAAGTAASPVGVGVPSDGWLSTGCRCRGVGMPSRCLRGEARASEASGGDDMWGTRVRDVAMRTRSRASPDEHRETGSPTACGSAARVRYATTGTTALRRGCAGTRRDASRRAEETRWTTRRHRLGRSAHEGPALGRLPRARGHPPVRGEYGTAGRNAHDSLRASETRHAAYDTRPRGTTPHPDAYRPERISFASASAPYAACIASSIPPACTATVRETESS